MNGQFEWVDIWRDPTDKRWAKAHQIIAKIFRFAFHKHPISNTNPSPEEQESWLGMFWVHLTESPQTLAASITHHKGAVYTEAWRFLDKTAHADEHAIRQKLVRHLRSKKILPVLKDHEAFRNSFANFWELVQPDIPKENLGAIPSILTPQNPTQIPPLVQKELLPPHLKQILRAEERATTDWDLTEKVWDKLEPNPDGVLLLSQTEATEDMPISESTHEDAGLKQYHKAESSFEMDLPFYVAEILEGVSLTDQHIVAALLMGRSQQAIADEYGTSRRGVQEAYARFKESLQKIIDRADLSEEEVRTIIKKIVHTWQDELFSIEQGE